MPVYAQPEITLVIDQASQDLLRGCIAWGRELPKAVVSAQ
jgi:hypothetical protein